MTKIEDIYKLLKKIAKTGGATDDMMEDIRRLKDEFDEREGMLKKYGESQDRERKYSDEDVERYIKERDEIRNRYIDRWLNGDEKAFDVEREKFTNGDEIKKEQREDVKRDGKKQTFEELFEEREG